MEASGAGAEAAFVRPVQLLPEAAALRGDEREGEVLLLGHEQAGVCSGLRALTPIRHLTPGMSYPDSLHNGLCT